MGLYSWWKTYYKKFISSQIDDVCAEHIEDSVQDYERYKKLIAKDLFPRKGDDLLQKKELFIKAFTIKEHEFQRVYMDIGNNQYNTLKSKLSRDKEQHARLIAQMKWRRLLSYRR